MKLSRPFSRVNQMHARMPLVAALAAALACSGGSGGPTAIEIPIAAIDVTQPCGVLIEGDQCQIGVRATSADGSTITNPVLRYISSNSGAADVTTAGVVIGRAPGSATIFVTNSTGSVSDQFTATVLPSSNPK